MDKKASSFMDLVGFECTLRGGKKLLLKQEDLDSLLKSISTSSPASILISECECWKWGRCGQNVLNFWNLAFENE